MKKTLQVKKMHCKSCEMLIQDVLEDLDVKSTASHEQGTVRIDFDESKVTLDQIKKAVYAEGYEVE